MSFLMIQSWGIPLGIMAEVPDYEIIGYVFQLQLNCYIHFQTNTLGKGMNPINPSALA